MRAYQTYIMIINYISSIFIFLLFIIALLLDFFENSNCHCNGTSYLEIVNDIANYLKK